MSARIAFSNVKSVDLKRKRATVVGPGGENEVYLVDVPSYMLLNDSGTNNYEVLEISDWAKHNDRTICLHEDRPHPSILVEEDGWYAQCQMPEGEWMHLINLKSCDIPKAKKDLENARKVVWAGSPLTIKAYDSARRVFNSFIDSNPWTEEDIGKKFWDFREDAWELLISKKGRGWKDLYQTLTPGDVSITFGLLGKHYFKSDKGPKNWANARGFKLLYKVVKASHNKEPMKVCAAGTCATGMSSITITAARTWLKDTTRGEQSITSVGKIRCTHPFDCFCYIMAHEFAHFLCVVFGYSRDQHGPVWATLARNMFGLKNKTYLTEMIS
jgi:hypothetical protein